MAFSLLHSPSKSSYTTSKLRFLGLRAPKNTHIIQIPFFSGTHLWHTPLAHTFGTPRLELAEGWKERKILQKNVIWHSLSVKMADQKRLLSVFLRQKWNFYRELRFGIAFDCSYSVCHDKRAVAEKKISNNK